MSPSGHRAWRCSASLLLLTNLPSPEVAEARVVTRAADGSWGRPTRWRKPSCDPVFSPDSRFLVCVDLRILLTTPTGDSLRVSVDPTLVRHQVQYAGGSSDGRTVYYLGTDSVGANVYAVPLAGGVPRVVVRFDDPTRPWHRYGFGGYGDRFYFTVGDRESDVWVANVGAAPP